MNQRRRRVVEYNVSASAGSTAHSLERSCRFATEQTVKDVLRGRSDFAQGVDKFHDAEAQSRRAQAGYVWPLAM